MKLRIFLAIVLVVLVRPNMAQAYIDPGSGSFVIQAVVASLAIALGFFGQIKNGVIGIVKKFRKDKKDSNEPEVK